MVEENCSRPDQGIKAVILSNKSGNPLVTIKLDDCLDESLMAPFITAIKSFSIEVLGGGQDLYFQTGGMDLYCFTKGYEGTELMVFALMEKSLEKKDIGGEAESALDAFVENFSIETIATWKGDRDTFKQFELFLQEQIKHYYEKIAKDPPKGRKGFLARLFGKFKK